MTHGWEVFCYEIAWIGQYCHHKAQGHKNGHPSLTFVIRVGGNDTGAFLASLLSEFFWDDRIENVTGQ